MNWLRSIKKEWDEWCSTEVSFPVGEKLVTTDQFTILLACLILTALILGSLGL